MGKIKKQQSIYRSEKAKWTVRGTSRIFLIFSRDIQPTRLKQVEDFYFSKDIEAISKSVKSIIIC